MDNLIEIKINNFKSFTEETISLSGVTCFVGANESGKTNLLDAIHHLSKKSQMLAFSPDDLRIGAPNYPDGEIRIRYAIKLDDLLIKDLVNYFPTIVGKLLYLTKIGRPRKDPVWECSLDIKSNSVPDIIEINKKQVFVRGFKQDKEKQKIAKKRSDVGWFLNDSLVDLRKNPYNKFLDKDTISLTKNKDKADFISQLVGEKVLNNIKIYKWKYKEENFLQENVPIEDLIKHPNRYRSVKNMFLISGWKLRDFPKKLKGQTVTVYSNLLDEVKRNIDDLIRRNWSSHKNLKIEIEHRGKTLSIHLHEPGSKTPPEFRSDGLKWFLTFLINFRAQSQNISNYILLIDEPGLYLHPRGQKDALEELENLSQNNQIIYTTHQTFLINKNKPERVRIIKRVPEKKGRLSIHPFYASKATEANDSKSILTDKLLREALGFKVSDISPINERNILTEGVFDREVFHLVNDYWQVIDLNETSIISCGRASEIAKHASLYKGNELKVVCFYDSDGPGRSSYNSNDKVLLSEKKQVRDFIKKPVYETMEDLIPEKVYKEAIEEWAKQWKIKSSVTTKRPRMKNIKKHFVKGNDIKMKHELERIIIDKIKLELRRDGAEFKIFKTILSDFKTVL